MCYEFSLEIAINSYRSNSSLLVCTDRIVSYVDDYIQIEDLYRHLLSYVDERVYKVYRPIKIF